MTLSAKRHLFRDFVTDWRRRNKASFDWEQSRAQSGCEKAKATFIGKVCGCEGEGDDPGPLRNPVPSDIQV